MRTRCAGSVFLPYSPLAGVILSEQRRCTLEGERAYLVPDYFPEFHCKMGACRRPCCEGWPVSITMTDYFRLIGLDCSQELRRRLDCCLHIAPHPSPEAYAQITPRYDGHCPLHMEDGRCALHAELGEGVLAAVCRLYPRGARTGEFHECSCANSCEAVPELLLHRDAPLRFINVPLAPGLPEAPERRHDFHTEGREQEIRLWLISFLQRRDFPLSRRMLHLGSALHAMDDALQARDSARVAALLDHSERIHVPEMPVPDHAQLASGLRIASRLLSIIDERSNSVRAYGETALKRFTEGGFVHYQRASAQFEALVPQWQTWFEHLLVNHMFFVQFPFQDRPVPLKVEFLSLCAIYTLLRFLCLGCMPDCRTIDDVVDVVAAAFRLIDHTTFDRYAGAILTDAGCAELEDIRNILSL